MHTNRFLKGLAVGAAGGALVLAGVAGTGTVASATPSQDATVNASPDRSDQANIYNLLQGDLKGTSGTWDGTGSVHGGWLQGPIGELQVLDHNGTHSWPVREVRLTPAALSLQIRVGGVWNNGTLQGEVKNSRTTVYNGTLDSRKVNGSGNNHIRITNFKVHSEFRGYNLVSGTVEVEVGILPIDIKVRGGCLFRGKGNLTGDAVAGIWNVLATLETPRGAITASEFATKMVVVGNHFGGTTVDMKLKDAKAEHTYSGTGTTFGKDWTVTDLKIAKRTSTSPECDWDPKE